MIIAIDGSASSGKGTLAKRLARHFSLSHLDTGALYRAVGLQLLNAGYDPKIILSGRKINDNMGKEIAKFLYDKFKTKKIISINILGLTFKENCNDIRNSRIIDIINYFNSKRCQIKCHDPLLEYKKINIENINIINSPFHKLKKTDILLINVAHEIFKKKSDKDIKKLLKKNTVIYDLKGMLSKREFITNKLYNYFTP